MTPMLAQDVFGYFTKVKLSGENLHEQQTKCHIVLPPTSLPPLYDLTYEGIQEARDAEFMGRFLDEYIENPRRQFSSKEPGCSYIDLGHYAPFLRNDRKNQTAFDIKNFIFSSEPSGWAFDVREEFGWNRLKAPQALDITDDLTGMPHDVATKNIAMYVNETGGDPNLKQTVWSGQVQEREVNYYFRHDDRMEKGKRLELLVSTCSLARAPTPRRKIFLGYKRFPHELFCS
jgi:hypothetical protein